MNTHPGPTVDATPARQRLDRLVREYGSVSAVARVLGDRFGMAPQNAARTLWRIRAGAERVEEAVLDRLEVL